MSDVEKNDYLVLPTRATVNLVTPNNEPLKLGGVIISVHCFARHKNDFHLGPFFTNNLGVAEITRELLDIFVDATRESGLMDYSGINNCFPFVEIRLWSKADIKNAIEGRTIWPLLGREKELWRNVDELVAMFRAAPNPQLMAYPIQLRDEWDGRKLEYEYRWQISDCRKTPPFSWSGMVRNLLGVRH